MWLARASVVLCVSGALIGCGGGSTASDGGGTGDGGGSCGDGIVDMASGEQCDDGNNIAFDGCEPDTCLYTCSTDGECDDHLPCNGAETCSTDHVCQLGDALAAGTTCARDGMPDGVCRGMGTMAMCVDGGCGNGVIDGSEQCDDGNAVPGDGCEADCTFSCEADSDCDDGSVCSGTESCNSTNHTCETTGPLDCDDGDACTDDTCDPVDGCQNTLIDGDMDGYASTDLGACGTDCNDADPMTHPGAPELCEPPGTTPVDNDCDPATPNPSASLWFLDCDEDGYSTSGAPSTMSCDMPAPQGGCGWTTRVPVLGDATTVDCNDANGDMHPGQTMYFTSAHSSGSTDDARYGNYNCDGTAQYDHSRTNNADSSDSCTPSRSAWLGNIYCAGSSGWATTSTVDCGFSGTYTTCGSPSPCSSGSLCAIRRGCGAVCTSSSSATCSSTQGCTPGSRGCPWAYYCCGRSTDASARMGCH